MKLKTHSEELRESRQAALLALWFSIVVSASVVAVFSGPAEAQDVLPSAPRTLSPELHTFVEPALFAFYSDSGSPVEIRGITRNFAPRWSASYGLGLADETALTADLLRYDHTLGFGTRSDDSSRDNWRHFLGLQYAPIESFSLMGGVAKAGGLSGGKGTSLSPTGYERLRLNAGTRWSFDSLGWEGWALDSSFSFIPTGATRMPSDAGYFPGMGDSSATWFTGVTVSRRF